MDKAPGSFTLMASGQLESAEVRGIAVCVLQLQLQQQQQAGWHTHLSSTLQPDVMNLVTQIPGCQTAYCKFELVAGEDWQILDGMDTGITQVARQSTGAQGAAIAV
jgi:hypothetical protein